MNDCNYKIFNNKRLMPKQEKRKEKEDETFDRSQYKILWTAKNRTIPQASKTKQKIYIRTAMER